jgi:ornithine cyclodeaminase/alanine dehydrogenase-like protein (mu-crystallin family)
MTLPTWWLVTTPHKDIREGRLSEAIFAADLGDVVYGKAETKVDNYQRTLFERGGSRD